MYRFSEKAEVAIALTLGIVLTILIYVVTLLIWDGELKAATWSGKKGLSGDIIFSGYVQPSAELGIEDEGNGLISYNISLPEGVYSGHFRTYAGEEMLASLPNGIKVWAQGTPALYYARKVSKEK